MFVRGKVSCFGGWGLAVAALLAAAGCLAPGKYREKADRTAQAIIEAKQREALGRTNSPPFDIERPSDTLRRRLLEGQTLQVAGDASYGSDRLAPGPHQPEKDYPRAVASGEGLSATNLAESVTLSLVDALRVAARNSRQYQDQKEEVFQAALNLDLEIDVFRSTYRGMLESIFSTDQSGPTFSGVENTGDFSASRKLKSGAALTSRLVVDFAKVLSSGSFSAIGLAADASVTIPLLRGAGKHVVTEPLTQAERDVIYAIWGFERFKREFTVSVMRQYFDTLQSQDRVRNARDSYENQVASTRRTRAMLEAGREGMEPGQLDQALSQELQSRNNWISAQQQYESALDRFKITLGLPTDARVFTDPAELERLSTQADGRLRVQIPTLDDLRAEELPAADAEVVIERPSEGEGGPFEIPEQQAVRLALGNRLDLRTAVERVYDAQRKVAVAANLLKPGVDVVGGASFGERRALGTAALPNAELRPGDGNYSAALLLDLPFERTAERNTYRNSYIALERSVRSVQSLEDTVKQEIRVGLRNLLEQRESYKIQVVAERVARRRVERTRAFQTEGRAVSTRDINEALTDLLNAQNQVTESLIEYRISELELQRDMGVLEIDEDGLYREFDPGEFHES